MFMLKYWRRVNHTTLKRCSEAKKETNVLLKAVKHLGPGMK
jgi:hypothetical protein